MAGARVSDHKTIAAWWVPTIASATLAPTVAEVTAGTNLTCDIEKGSSFVTFTGDKTSTSSGSVCEDTDIETVQGATYGGEHVYFRRFTAGAPATDDVITTLPELGEYGYWVIREGYAYDLAIAAGQKVDVFFVQAGSRRKVRGTGQDTIRMRQSYYSAGQGRENLTVLT